MGEGQLLARERRGAIDGSGKRPEERSATSLPCQHFLFAGWEAIGYLEGHLQLWGLEEEKLIRELEGYQGEVLDLAFSPDGKILAVIFGYPDAAIQLWKVPEGERLLSIKGVEWTRFLARRANPGYRVKECRWHGSRDDSRA